ncbi:MAG: DUF4332 domain-containing protein [Synechococcales cyanobacterium C42_A2020_086]|jgi:hypothetical protein|nr:DUF4332 domain-containing protein [Synechococcales cyanobacterium C42_A2020_086]
MSQILPSAALQPLLRPSNWAIEQLPGLNSRDQTQLKGSGIDTTFQLLNATRTSAQRQALATRLQLHLRHINKWVALADLARVPAIGCQYCGLVLHAGISSPQQLAQTPLARLHRQILKLYVAMLQQPNLCPRLDEVATWIEQAKQISPIRPSR